MADLTIPKGDYGYYINFTILDSDGVAYDLTGYTIKFKVWTPGFFNTLFLNGTCSIVVAGSGTCRYLVASGNFDIINIYSFELELTQTGVVESTKIKSLAITESG